MSVPAHGHALFAFGSGIAVAGYLTALLAIVIGAYATNHANKEQVQIKQLQHQVQVLRREVKS